VLAGAAFDAPPSAYSSLQSAYAQAAARSPGTGGTPLTALGIDPQAWLARPRAVGDVRLDGVMVVHVSAGLLVPPFLADLNRITGAGGELALGGAASTSSLSAAELKALARSIGASSVEVYVGASDHVLRELDLRASIHVPPAEQQALGGLQRGTLTFTLGFAAINRPVTIAAPPHPMPLSTLVSELQRLGVGGAAAGASTGTTAQTTTTTTSANLSGVAPAAYLRCFQQAGQNLVARAKCAPLLSGG